MNFAISCGVMRGIGFRRDAAQRGARHTGMHREKLLGIPVNCLHGMLSLSNDDDGSRRRLACTARTTLYLGVLVVGDWVETGPHVPSLRSCPQCIWSWNRWKEKQMLPSEGTQRNPA